jgi:hypothetical protein
MAGKLQSALDMCRSIAPAPSRRKLAQTFPVIALAALFAPAADASPGLEKAAEDAFVYGYPLVLVDATERQMTASFAPVNRFFHADRLATPAERMVVRPNTDTLYSSAWLDLAQGPIVLHVPSTEGRYYLMQVLDAWTNVVADPGTRTTGSSPGDFVIVGPRFAGALPAGLVRIQSPTRTAWIIGRTQVFGARDLDAARAVQAGFTLTSLTESSAPEATPSPAPAARITPPEEVARMDGATFLSRLAALMHDNPPQPADAPMIGRLVALGLSPDGTFKPSPEVASMLDATKEGGLARITEEVGLLGVRVNGWRIVRHTGRYGTKYLVRAAVGMAGLGANLPEDALYPTAFVDGRGEPLTGSRRYTLHFDAGELPPADAFWSITMYDENGYLVDNPEGRYAIHDYDSLVRNADGSLDVYVQSEPPREEHRSNWLPAPAGAPFSLTLRLYTPRPEVVRGPWAPPPIEPALD